MTEQTMALYCPHCCAFDFKVFQIFNDQNRRTGLKLECISCKSIIYADTSFELATKFPE